MEKKIWVVKKMVERPATKAMIPNLLVYMQSVVLRGITPKYWRRDFYQVKNSEKELKKNRDFEY